jgi:glycosyltransferase involved in cell wall biosynthesis
MMKVVLLYYDALHYHLSRHKALNTLLAQRGGTALLYCVSPTSHHWQEPGYQDEATAPNRVLCKGGGPIWCRVVGTARLWSQLSKDSPDVVCTAGYSEPFSLVALAWSKVFGRAAVCMHVTTRWDRRRRRWRESLKRRIAPLFDAAICGGGPQKEYLAELGMPLDRIVTGYNVVDNSYFAAAADVFRRSRGVETPPYFFTASRLVATKNVDCILQAYAALKRAHPACLWKLRIAGKGPDEASLRSLAEQLGIRADTEFLGYLRTDALAGQMAGASAFILASREAEPWGLAVNEAMAAGIPSIVSSKCGCCADLIKDSVTGWSFDPSDYVQLSEVMARVAINDTERQSVAAHGFQRIMQFTPTSFAERMSEAAGIALDHARALGAS